MQAIVIFLSGLILGGIGTTLLFLRAMRELIEKVDARPKPRPVNRIAKYWRQDR